MSDLEQLKYPIGTFSSPDTITDTDIDDYIRSIKEFPALLRALVENFSDDQLNTQYREGGWTVRQVVNHIADSHTNAYFRFKLALTEECPTVKPYDEKQWAELQDSRTICIKPALQMIEGVHARWTYELKALTNKEFESTFFHPDDNARIALKNALAKYVWHGKHHLAQIKSLKERMQW